MEGDSDISNTVVVSDIRPMIHEVRNSQVMFDRDLSALYQVPTKALNQAVKRNNKRFPEEFAFRLSEEEMTELVTKCDRFATLKHSSVPMMAFTEQGVAMLSAVLKSEVAIRESVRIMKAFVAMRRTLAALPPQLADITARLEATERRQISDQSRNDARFEEIFAKMNEGEFPLAQVFYQGKFWDAKSLLIKFIRRAKKNLIVVDAYVGVATLDMLAKRTRGVSIELVTHSNGELAETDFEAFGKQCGKFTKTICGICHDRFIIVDEKEIFWTGASLKDAGRLTFAAAKMGEEVIPGLLSSIRKATSNTKKY